MRTRTTVLSVILAIMFLMMAGTERVLSGSDQEDDLTVETKTIKVGKDVFTVDQGEIKVPENRSKQNGRTITLPVIRLHSTSANPGDPVFILHGGPGGSNMISMDNAENLSYSWLLQDRDVVLVGYRGFEGSVILTCPTAISALKAGNDVLSIANIQRVAKAFRADYDKIVESGVDIDAYNVIEVVDDMEAVRKAMDYKKVNLLSVSYGTRVAYLYGIRYPQSINRSVMVAVNPPGRMVWEPDQQDAILQRYAELWRKDEYASSQSPDLIKTIKHVFATFPRKFEWYDIDPGKVKLATFYMLYSTNNAAQVFEAFVAAEKGDNAGIGYLSYAWTMFPFPSEGFGDSPSKAFSADYDPERDYENDMDPEKYILGAPFSRLMWSMAKYDAWPIKRIPEEYRKLQTSDVETLLVGGTLDVSTPVENARDDLLPHLKNGSQVILAEMGHQDLTSLQPVAFRHMVRTYYQNGTVDKSKFKPHAVNFKPEKTYGDMAKEMMAKNNQKE